MTTSFFLSEMVSNESRFCLAKASGAAPDHVTHVSEERHSAHLQVIVIVKFARCKCPLIFLEDKERLTATTYSNCNEHDGASHTVRKHVKVEF